MSRKARLILIALAMGGLLAIPISAIGAVSLWDDIPDESIFVNDTNWMKITGVSLGCNPPLNTEYCPKEFMTREQMAALLRRLSQGQIVNAATAVDSDKVDGRIPGAKRGARVPPQVASLRYLMRCGWSASAPSRRLRSAS